MGWRKNQEKYRQFVGINSEQCPRQLEKVKGSSPGDGSLSGGTAGDTAETLKRRKSEERFRN